MKKKSDCKTYMLKVYADSKKSLINFQQFSERLK